MRSLIEIIDARRAGFVFELAPEIGEAVEEVDIAPEMEFVGSGPVSRPAISPQAPFR